MPTEHRSEGSNGTVDAGSGEAEIGCDCSVSRGPVRGTEGVPVMHTPVVEPVAAVVIEGDSEGCERLSDGGRTRKQKNATRVEEDAFNGGIPLCQADLRPAGCSPSH